METDLALFPKAAKALQFLYELNVWYCSHRPTRRTLTEMREAIQILELAVNTQRRWMSDRHKEVSES